MRTLRQFRRHFQSRVKGLRLQVVIGRGGCIEQHARRQIRAAIRNGGYHADQLHRRYTYLLTNRKRSDACSAPAMGGPQNPARFRR